MVTVRKYYKESCAPCLSMGRILDKVGKKMSFQLENIEVNQNPDKAKSANVQAVPTIVIESNGVEVQRWQGVKSSKEIKNILDMYI